MTLIAVLVFIGIFILIALPLAAMESGPSKSARQALATLDSVLKTGKREVREQIVNLRKDEHFSSIPWLNRRLVNFDLAPHLRSLISQAALSWSAGRLLSMMGALFVAPVYLVYLRFGILWPGLLAGLPLGFLPLGWVLLKRRRRFGKFEKGMPEALDLMVSALRAGHSLIAAMGLVARECADPVGTEIKTCFEEQNYGLEMKVALDNLLRRVPIQDLRMVATAIMIQKETGGNLAEVLDRTSILTRDRFRLKRQVKTHTAQGRMTGWVLTCVPVVLGVGMYCVNPQMMSVLWHRDIGIKLLWGAAGLTALGGFVINRIVSIDI